MAPPLLNGPFTVDSYQRLAELGVLREDDRVELIAGQVVQMSPIGDRHAACVRRLNGLLTHAFHGIAIVDVQNPIVLGERDAPQPDLTALEPRDDGYRKHPRAPDTLLVIEVADTTVAYDREVKVPLYARAGVPEVWLIDLPADAIDVYRDPREGSYASVWTVARGDRVSPARFPHTSFPVDEILG